MKVEKAINWIRYASPYKAVTPDKMREFLKARYMAVEALEKHIPKEPIWEGDGYSDGEMVYDTWFCPNCDASYEEDEEYHYCPGCGQKILWED